MDMVRPAPDSPPAKSLPGMGDHPTAITLYAAIATALFRRERTGRGGYVATNLMANGLWWNALHAQAMLCGAEFPRRPGREDAPSALSQLLPHRRRALAPARRHPRGQALAVARAGGRGGRTSSRTRASLPAEHRHANHRALIRELDAAFATAPLAEWRRRLDEHGVAYGVISTLRDIPEDRQMLESGALTALDDPEAGARHVVSTPLWIDGAPRATPSRPPGIGEHSVEILSEHGFSPEDIEELRKAGAIPGAAATPARPPSPVPDPA